MVDASAAPLDTPLPLPVRGGSTRAQVGSHEAVLESVRGGFAFLWTNGRSATKHLLGLVSGGSLRVALRAPKWPVRIAPREALTVVPGARLAGYVHVRLVPTLLWRDAVGTDHVLLEIPAEDQVAEWDDHAGCVLHAASPWFVRFPMRNGEARAIVPLRLRNTTATVVSPAHLDVQLRDDELRPLRGSIVAAPRRMQLHAERANASVRDRAGGAP